MIQVKLPIYPKLGVPNKNFKYPDEESFKKIIENDSHHSKLIYQIDYNNIINFENLDFINICGKINHIELINNQYFATCELNINFSKNDIEKIFCLATLKIGQSEGNINYYEKLQCYTLGLKNEIDNAIKPPREFLSNAK